MNNLLSCLVISFLVFILSFNLHAQAIEFTEEKWTLTNGEIVDYMDRTALKGSATLKDVKMKNGIIEFDIVVSGQRSYPGIFFRMQSVQDYEHLYFRPHRAGLYPDAILCRDHYEE